MYFAGSIYLKIFENVGVKSVLTWVSDEIKDMGYEKRL